MSLERKPGSPTPPWPMLQFLLCVSNLDSLYQGPFAVRRNKLFPPQVACSHGVYPQSRKPSRTQHLKKPSHWCRTTQVSSYRWLLSLPKNSKTLFQTRSQDCLRVKTEESRNQGSPGSAVFCYTVCHAQWQRAQK